MVKLTKGKVEGQWVIGGDFNIVTTRADRRERMRGIVKWNVRILNSL